MAEARRSHLRQGTTGARGRPPRRADPPRGAPRPDRHRPGRRLARAELPGQRLRGARRPARRRRVRPVRHPRRPLPLLRDRQREHRLGRPPGPRPHLRPSTSQPHPAAGTRRPLGQHGDAGERESSEARSRWHSTIPNRRHASHLRGLPQAARRWQAVRDHRRGAVRGPQHRARSISESPLGLHRRRLMYTRRASQRLGEGVRRRHATSCWPTTPSSSRTSCTSVGHGARIITEPNVQGAPDLVVEVISPSIDQDETRRPSATSTPSTASSTTGWSIRSRSGSGRTSLATDGAYELVAEAHKDEAFSAPPFPDLTIRLAELWDEFGETDQPRRGRRRRRHQPPPRHEHRQQHQQRGHRRRASPARPTGPSRSRRAPSRAAPARDSGTAC